MYGSTVEIQKIQRMDSEEEVVDDEDIDLSPTTGDPDKDMEKVNKQIFFQSENFRIVDIEINMGSSFFVHL